VKKMNLASKIIIAGDLMTDEQASNCLEEIEDFFDDLKMRYDIKVL